MKISCKRCNPDEAFEVPNFSLDEKKLLLETAKVSPLKAVKEMMNIHNLTHGNAKFVMMHINLEHKKCNRCDYQLNILEYTSCTKCGSLNCNWNVSF
jgi:predicted Zn-ribbon and HTH transcriptional regulator